MYRAIIADDEPWVAYRLMRLVDWGALGFEVVATARDGEEAFTLCLEHRPDVLISDIRMPGRDGLQLLQALREGRLDTEVVLISGYAEFSYAQEAIRHGAFDYLIKQVSTEQLAGVLTRLREQLSQRKHGYDTLFSLLDEDSSMTIAQWLQRARKVSRFSCYRFYTFGITAQDYPGLWHVHEAEGFDQVLLRTGKEKASVLLCYDDESALRNEWNMPDGYCGYSEATDAQTPFVQLYRHSDIAFHTASFLRKSIPIAYRGDRQMTPMQALLAEMEQALLQANAARCQTLLSVFEARAQGMNLQQIATAYTWLSQLFSRYLDDLPDNVTAMDYRWLAQEFSSLQELTAMLRERLATPSALADEENQISKAIQFVDSSFTQELRIADLAQRFHFSASYFSTLFRKHTGKNFTKYLAEKRIAHIQGLLRDTGLPLQQIADQSGYGDYFQFNKAFKKHTGTTPGQYRKAQAPQR